MYSRWLVEPDKFCQEKGEGNACEITSQYKLPINKFPALGMHYADLIT